MLFQYLRDKKKKREKGAQEKGAENSPISPPLYPCLQTQFTLHMAGVFAYWRFDFTKLKIVNSYFLLILLIFNVHI